MHMETDRRAYVTEVTVQKYSFLFARFHEWKMSQNIRCPQYVGISFRFLILWFIWKKKTVLTELYHIYLVKHVCSSFFSFLLLCLSVCITFACGYTLVFLPPMSSTLSTHRTMTSQRRYSISTYWSPCKDKSDRLCTDLDTNTRLTGSS